MSKNSPNKDLFGVYFKGNLYCLYQIILNSFFSMLTIMTLDDNWNKFLYFFKFRMISCSTLNYSLLFVKLRRKMIYKDHKLFYY